MRAQERDGRRIQSLAHAIAVFASLPGPRFLAIQLLVFLAARSLHAAPASGGDALVVVVVALWWPLQEWWAHRSLLHFRPRPPPRWLARITGWTELDPYAARIHRAHHRAPHEIEKAMLPMRLLYTAAPIHLAVWLLITPNLGFALTGMAAFGGATLVYEWIHYLTHTAYKPRSAYFRAVRRGHRYHHYKSERHWFAFTAPVIDAAFGTAPDPRDVEVSPTVYTLGVEEERVDVP